MTNCSTQTDGQRDRELQYDSSIGPTAVISVHRVYSSPDFDKDFALNVEKFTRDMCLAIGDLGY